MNRFMRIIVMFDLPVITEKERKIATKFRKFLLDDGYIMMQYSVYSRICKNNDDLNKHIELLQNYSPDYVEELGLKYLNIGDPQVKILKI